MIEAKHSFNYDEKNAYVPLLFIVPVGEASHRWMLPHNHGKGGTLLLSILTCYF